MNVCLVFKVVDVVFVVGVKLCMGCIIYEEVVFIVLFCDVIVLNFGMFMMVEIVNVVFSV